MMHLDLHLLLVAVVAAVMGYVAIDAVKGPAFESVQFKTLQRQLHQPRSHLKEE